MAYDFELDNHNYNIEKDMDVQEKEKKVNDIMSAMLKNVDLEKNPILKSLFTQEKILKYCNELKISIEYSASLLYSPFLFSRNF